MTNEIIIDPNIDLYAVLDVPSSADEEQIRLAYKRQAMRWHPDRVGGNKERFQEVMNAFEILKNADHRAYYDRLREELVRYRGKKFSFEKEDILKADHRTLKDIIVQSLHHFQEKLQREIPKHALDDFGHACRWVYEVWREIKEEEAQGHADGTIDFGPFSITREQTEIKVPKRLKGRK